VTDRAAFSDAEWDLLVELPRWVAQAASAAEPNNARQASAEEESGLLAIADGRQSASPLVAELARQLVAIYDDPRKGAVTIDFHDVTVGLATVLGYAREVSQLLVAKMDAADAGAYRQWLLAITDTVIGTVRSGSVLGLGGSVVSEAERRFRHDLNRALYV